MASIGILEWLLIASPFLGVLLAYALHRIDEQRGDGYITIGGIR